MSKFSTNHWIVDLCERAKQYGRSLETQLTLRLHHTEDLQTKQDQGDSLCAQIK